MRNGRCRLLAMAVLAATLGPAGAVRADEGLERASVSSSGQQAAGQSWDPAISADGRYVAFFSSAANLVAGDTNATGDIFVRDRSTGQTTRVSVATGGTQANATSADPAISADGRRIAFWSRASNLVPGDTNGVDDVFVHDRETGATTRVSVSSAGAQGNYRSSDPAISGDGRSVAFTSEATTLTAVPSRTTRVFLHDLVDGTTVKISRDVRVGAEIWHAGTQPSLSGDGRQIAYAQFVDTLSGSGFASTNIHIYVHDRASGDYLRITRGHDGSRASQSSHAPSISADGRWVAFHSMADNLVAGDTNGTPDAFLHDAAEGLTTRVSVASDGTQGNGSTWAGSRLRAPGISADGRYVAFVSTSTNLVPGDTNACGNVGGGMCPDVFVHDRVARETTRHNVAADGAQANGTSEAPVLSADGRRLAFYTQATNLLLPDHNSWSEDVLVGHVSRFAAPHATDLVARDAARVAGADSHAGDLRATLTKRRDGAPVEGREIRFSADGSLICTATTGSDGVASCPYVSQHVAALLAAGQYEARFSGDDVYTESADHASALVLLPPPL